MRTLVMTVVAIFGLTQATHAQDVATSSPTPPYIGYVDIVEPVAVRKVGRMLPDGQHQWPGIYAESTITGGASVNFHDTTNIYNIYIDGNLLYHGKAKKLPFSVRAQTWDDKNYTLRIEKVSESQSTATIFPDVTVRNTLWKGGTHSDGQPMTPLLPDEPGRIVERALPPPPARARQIEFIGDSYTVGYGNMSDKRQCTPDELHATTNTQKAYGPMTAKAFKADYQINAFSGRGIVRNYDGFAGDPLPALHPYVLFDKKDEYKDDRWKPQIIVIGLGGNDFSTPVKPGEKWKDEAALKADYEQSFVAFVKTLRAKHPQAFFLLTKYEGPTVAEEVEKVAAQLKAQGETRLDTIGLDGFTLNGCDWHLDSNDHKRISEQLTGYFNAHPDLWQGQ
jgi:lysophospholipase L1-like esterase